jgi:hypothetical protein
MGQSRPLRRNTVDQHDRQRPLFQDAAWLTRVDPLPEGSRVFCSVDFTLRPTYVFLAPSLYATKRAILTDLEYLKRAVEHP